MNVPQFAHSSAKMYEIPAPGKGGLNLQDLEYEQTSNQSPDMLNMCYRNGAFGKRFGQEVLVELEFDIIKMAMYGSKVIIHAGHNLYEYDNGELRQIYFNLNDVPGVFFNFNKNIYYLNGDFICYDGNEVKPVEAYAPDLVINRTPDGTYSDLIENYNRLGSAFKNTFNGDGESTVYVLTDKELDNDSEVTCEVDGEAVTDFTVDYTEGKVTFKKAPTKGQNNVVITAHKTTQKYIDSIVNCIYSSNYGGNNNSRVFLAGSGDATIYYSDVFDATYWPEMNYIVLGNTDSDISGFGEQNDALMVFKPDSMYRIDYTLNNEGEAAFNAFIINPKIGCNAPDSIQLINNRLTWLSNMYGVCTLVSTMLENEKNVQVISRNVNGGFRANGLLQEPELEKAKAVNWNGQYWLSVNDHVYMWDYTITPYSDTGKPDYDASRLAWFLFDNFKVKDFVVDDVSLLHARDKAIVGLTDEYNDFGEAITAYYQTPMLTFGKPEFFKNVRKCFVQVRASTPSKYDIKYITDDNPDGYVEQEQINVPARLFDFFSWDAFGWDVFFYAKTFARYSRLKKIQMCSVKLANDEVNRDLSVSSIRFSYSLVKEVN